MLRTTSHSPHGSDYPWLIVASGCLIIALAMGPRPAMGVFQIPILAQTGWTRADFGLAMATQNLIWGFGQPFLGAIADRFGTWRVLALSGLLYAIGLLLMAISDSLWQLHLGGGILTGLGIAGGSFSIVLAAFARNVSPERRGFAFGLATAAGSAGMFVLAPVSQALVGQFGWQDSLLILSALMLLIPVLATPLAGNAFSGRAVQPDANQSIIAALREALGHPSYLLLAAGFFVSGFQVTYFNAHFPIYINDIGIDAQFAVIGLAAIGFFNVIGALVAGMVGERFPKRFFLALIYLARSIAVLWFLMTPQTGTSVVVFSIVMGLLWLSTVPPTTALVVQMFGTRHLGMLGGFIFLTYQLGSYFGVWIGGELYEFYGSYDPVWVLGITLGFLAAALHLPIKEESVPRPQFQPAQ